MASVNPKKMAQDLENHLLQYEQDRKRGMIALGLLSVLSVLGLFL